METKAFKFMVEEIYFIIKLTCIYLCNGFYEAYNFINTNEDNA